MHSPFHGKHLRYIWYLRQALADPLSLLTSAGAEAIFARRPGPLLGVGLKLGLSEPGFHVGPLPRGLPGTSPALPHSFKEHGIPLTRR